MSLVETENNNSSTPKNDNSVNSKENTVNAYKPKYNNRRVHNNRPGYSKGFGNKQEKKPFNENEKAVDKNIKDSNAGVKNNEITNQKGKKESREIKQNNSGKEIQNENRNNFQQKSKNENFRNVKKEKNNYIKPEETADDIRKDTKRIEKEIELEIREIGALKLGL